MSAALPVQTATAERASSSTSEPSGFVTTTRFGPARRALPRTRSMPAEFSHDTWPLSSKFDTSASRRAKTAATSRPPVTACFAPATCSAPRSAAPGRSSAFEGMHAQ